jgi:hypothetical protein
MGMNSTRAPVRTLLLARDDDEALGLRKLPCTVRSGCVEAHHLSATPRIPPRDHGGPCLGAAGLVAYGARQTGQKRVGRRQGQACQFLHRRHSDQPPASNLHGMASGLPGRPSQRVWPSRPSTRGLPGFSAITATSTSPPAASKAARRWSALPPATPPVVTIRSARRAARANAWRSRNGSSASAPRSHDRSGLRQQHAQGGAVRTPNSAGWRHLGGSTSSFPVVQNATPIRRSTVTRPWPTAASAPASAAPIRRPEATTISPCRRSGKFTAHARRDSAGRGQQAPAPYPGPFGRNHRIGAFGRHCAGHYGECLARARRRTAVSQNRACDRQRPGQIGQPQGKAVHRCAGEGRHLGKCPGRPGKDSPGGPRKRQVFGFSHRDGQAQDRVHDFFDRRQSGAKRVVTVAGRRIESRMDRHRGSPKQSFKIATHRIWPPGRSYRESVRLHRPDGMVGRPGHHCFADVLATQGRLPFDPAKETTRASHPAGDRHEAPCRAGCRDEAGTHGPESGGKGRISDGFARVVPQVDCSQARPVPEGSLWKRA